MQVEVVVCGSLLLLECDKDKLLARGSFTSTHNCRNMISYRG